MAKRILVADDSVTIQKAFAMVLGGQDVTLLSARSVEEALSAAKHGRPDLVIADALLGSGSGYDLCASLKADAGLRSVPVYILASSHVPYDEGRGHRAGAAGSLVKPFESQSLIDQITTALAQAPAAPPPAVVRAEPARPMAAPPPAAIPQAMPQRETDRLELRADDDDDYGEFIVERPGSGSAPAPAAVTRPAPAPAPSPFRAPGPPAAPPPSLRPSLIPGIRPGAPRETTSRPIAAAPPAAPSPVVAPSPSPGLHRQVTNRTMMGVPAMMTPPSSPPVQARPTAPAPAPGQPPAAAPGSGPRPSPFAPSAPAAAAVSNMVAQKMSALASRGPEYEAIAKLSREIIEQVVWEIVPELAEAIIRQEVDRLAAAKR